MKSPEHNPRSVIWLILILAPLFFLNARWGEQANVDSIATGLPAWQLVRSGSLDLSDFVGENPWLVADKAGRLVSDRAPGLIAVAIPGYFAWQSAEFTNGPASLIALLSCIAGALILWWLLAPHVGDRFAFWAAIVYSLGTTTWAVSSAQMWPHGPGQLLALLSLAALAVNRPAFSGFSAAMAITVRPVAAVWVSVLGLLEAIRTRSLSLLITFASAAASGLIVVVFYNQWLFGTLGLRGGGYAGLAGGFGGYFGSEYFSNVFAVFLGPRHGFLVMTPILLVATFGLFRYRHSQPGWATSGAVAALAYLLVHAGLNRASGGMETFYRYPLEAIALAAPSLGIASKQLFDSGGFLRRIVVGAAFASVLIQVINVFYFSCFLSTPELFSCFLV